MLVLAGLVSSPPLLVPELAGAAEAETAQLRRASLDVAARLGAACPRWIALGADEKTRLVDNAASGSYRGYGADVEVGLSPRTIGAPDASMPLAALTTAWLRGAAAPATSVDVRTYAATASAADCTRWGRELRAELDTEAEPIALLVVADGATTLTDKAPGALNEQAPAVQAALDDALSRGDVGALAALDADLCRQLGIDGRVPWQVLAAAIGTTSVAATPLYIGSPYGVGYFCGIWQL